MPPLQAYVVMGLQPELGLFFSVYFYLIHLMLYTSVHRHNICYKQCVNSDPPNEGLIPPEGCWGVKESNMKCFL